MGVLRGVLGHQGHDGGPRGRGRLELGDRRRGDRRLLSRCRYLAALRSIGGWRHVPVLGPLTGGAVLPVGAVGAAAGGLGTLTGSPSRMSARMIARTVDS